jgi:chromosome segregation ATPase
MPYCNTDAADAHFDKIKMLTTSETNAVKRWFTRSNHFTSKSSMYSDTITVDVAALNDKPAKFCKPSQPNLAYELQAQLEAMDAELAGLRATADTAKRAHNACKTETQRITTEISKLKHSDIQSLKARAKDIQSQITEHDTDPEEARQNFTRSIAATVKSRVAPLLALRDISPQWIEANVELAAMLLKRGLLKSRAEAATATYREAREASAQLRQRLAAAKAEFEQAKEQTKTLRNEAKRRADKTPELEAQWAELPDTLEELDDQIDNHRVRIQAISPNPAIMEKYTAREEEIHKLEESLANHDANLKEKQARIDELRDSWLPEIESFIDAIDQNFSEYFKQIGCVGNIRLAKDGDDFASYGIDIWVSYRATDAPKKLDARVQSGGERSVATMLYLIALQELSDCPFRLVDEINQGMDPHNERMIFDRVTAQASKHNTPQYFLITPKLLPDLKFTPAITVLCVFNGPYMVDQDKWAVTV